MPRKSYKKPRVFQLKKNQTRERKKLAKCFIAEYKTRQQNQQTKTKQKAKYDKNTKHYIPFPFDDNFNYT